MNQTKSLACLIAVSLLYVLVLDGCGGIFYAKKQGGFVATLTKLMKQMSGLSWRTQNGFQKNEVNYANPKAGYFRNVIMFHSYWLHCADTMCYKYFIHTKAYLFETKS